VNLLLSIDDTQSILSSIVLSSALYIVIDVEQLTQRISHQLDSCSRRWIEWWEIAFDEWERIPSRESLKKWYCHLPQPQH